MPDISFFEFWEYIPHNNVLWIWIKLGFLGFAATLFMFGRAVQLGARSIALVRTNDHVAFVAVGLTYVVMFLVFAYVDIAWDPRSTVMLGLAMALCADFVQAHDRRCRPPARAGLRAGAAVTRAERRGAGRCPRRGRRVQRLVAGRHRARQRPGDVDARAASATAPTRDGSGTAAARHHDRVRRRPRPRRAARHRHGHRSTPPRRARRSARGSSGCRARSPPPSCSRPA